MAEPFSFEYSNTFGWQIKYTVEKIFLPQYIRKNAVEIFIGPEINNPMILGELHGNKYRVESFVNNIDADAAFLASVYSCDELTSASGNLTQARTSSISKKMKSPGFSHNVGPDPLDRKAMLTNGWLDMNDFIVRYLCNGDLASSRSAYTGLFSSYDFGKYAKLRNADAAASSSSHVSPDMWSDITRPYIVHFIKLLCAVGIIDLAIDAEAPESDPMEGIAYVRLTSLGKYAYGLADTYESAGMDNAEVFDLDPDNLIVTLLDKDSPYAMFLEQIGTKIGGNRYHITAKGIIAKSSGPEEVKSRLSNFKRIVCPKPEGIWAAMIEETEKRISPSLPINHNFILKHFDTKVPGLTDTIMHDTEIRQNIIIAQDGYILIKNLYIDDFRAKLKRAGYLI